MPFVTRLAMDGSNHSRNAARSLAAMLAGSSADFVLRLMHVQYRIPLRAAADREIVESDYRSEIEKQLRLRLRMMWAG